ncbi:hypothetical protein CAOG_01345 [Capsaspora owczarzaki ATCC 30864]|uniref:hypothetical protein n=1 Tax=Capsaspora owczarzaki (strain ATCC 30864) TaxID=595528 RepID=UPI0001FE299C|nr:hypothetical protein CAOG_01345 [Capsaspora owczarzaki ATCC 30864]|eukprot:XP_004349865.1 hypothetical protein CAOG_01345 [Capsaspora owczarzaki ATCC 30864]
MAGATEVQQTLQRIAARKGVLGVIITTFEGAPIMSTFDDERTALYASKVAPLVQTSRAALQDLDAQNDLTFLRLWSKKHEIIIAPDRDFLLVTVQDPSSNTAGNA